jgi:hypothetical protein
MSYDSKEVNTYFSIERVFLTLIIMMYIMNTFAFLNVKYNTAEYFIILINFLILTIFFILIILWIKKVKI